MKRSRNKLYFTILVEDTNNGPEYAEDLDQTSDRMPQIRANISFSFNIGYRVFYLHTVMPYHH